MIKRRYEAGGQATAASSADLTVATIDLATILSSGAGLLVDVRMVGYASGYSWCAHGVRPVRFEGGNAYAPTPAKSEIDDTALTGLGSGFGTLAIEVSGAEVQAIVTGPTSGVAYFAIIELVMLEP